ncbi:MAG TPA: ABC transporter substrate-binding protein, partial [Anaerolineales bacterium]|nr:ABC transporter substrate-binding protein [Anaerolineales bacterium]
VLLSIVLTKSALSTILARGCIGQEKKKTYKVGILVGLEFTAPIAEGFKAGMADLGYVEGENITYDVQVTGFDIPTYQNIIKKFIADKVDLIVVTPTEATMEAKALAKDTNIPVVFSFAFTEGMGIIDSVAQPGGNITGVRFPGVDIQLKRYDVMRQIAPDAKRLFMPYQRGYPIVAPQLEALEPLAKTDGVTLIPFPADNAAEIQAELDKRAATDDIGMDGILFFVEPLAVDPGAFEAIAKFAYEHKLPFGGVYNTLGEYSSVFGVNVDLFKSGKLAAPLADKVLKGTSAGAIPAVSPENFIQINYKVAKQFGLTIPESILKQADEIIR